MFSSVSWLKILTRFLLALFVINLALGTVGCKGKKKIAEQEQAAIQAQKNKTLAGLQALLDTKIRNMEDLEAAERAFASMDLADDDAQIQILKKKVRYYLDQERERLEREAAQENPATTAPNQEKALESRLNQDFGALAQGGNNANTQMKKEALLGLFASASTPVLIIISQSGSQVDYDRPTTIGKYLDYLIDTGNNANRVGKMVFDDSGKINELELIKQ